MNDAVSEVFTCDCGLPEHQFILYYWPDDADRLLYMLVHMVPHPSFLVRLKFAVKYLFGYRTPYGEYDDVTLNVEAARRLRDVADRFLENGSGREP